MLNKRNNQNLEEIRLRSRKPIILRFTNEEKILQELIETEDILQTLQNVCDNSIYSYQNQICEGFITIKGGHRVGITGNAVIKNLVNKANIILTNSKSYWIKSKLAYSFLCKASYWATSIILIKKVYVSRETYIKLLINNLILSIF